MDEEAKGKIEDGDEDLYFEMEFPVQNQQWRAGTICSSSSPEYGSRSTLDSRDSPSRDSRESSAGREYGSQILTGPFFFLKNQHFFSFLNIVGLSF